MDKIAVLIPCYNEEKTIEKVVGTQKRRFRRLLFMYIITILPTALQSWQKRPVQWYGRNISRGKAM